MLRTLPEDRKKKRKSKKTIKKKVVKKKTTKKKRKNVVPQEEMVTYKNGETVTYAEFIKRFTERTKFILRKKGTNLEHINTIKYVNSDTAHVSFKDGSGRFVHIG